MSTPRSLDQLVDSVTVEPGESVDKAMARAPWVQAFLAAPVMREVARRELLVFRVHCAWLLRTPPEQMTVTRTILREVQQRFFADNKFYQPTIHFTDIHNVVDEIFRYSENKTSTEYGAVSRFSKHYFQIVRDKT